MELKTSSPGFESDLYDVIPLKPLIHPVKEVSVLPVYEITSSPIFNRPYEFGKNSVPLGDSPISTLIVVANSSMSPIRTIS